MNRFLLLLLLLPKLLEAQVSGNINYQTQTRYTDQNISTNFNGNSDLIISVKGMANLKADTYVAIFHLTQVGTTAGEVNELLDARIERVLRQVSELPDVDTYVDMLSFVPVYEFETEKKIFSKKTYNEVPAGFELQKNLHIRYWDRDLLNLLLAICAEAEIYDLVRVDYFSESMEQTRQELRERAHEILQERAAGQLKLLGADSSSYQKEVVDSYRVAYPVERYQSYQSYSSSSLHLRKSAQVNTADKTTTLYYQPIMDKEFDFVIGPSILEPVIQVLYEVKYRLRRVAPAAPKQNYFLITPAGEVKALPLSN